MKNPRLSGVFFVYRNPIKYIYMITFLNNRSLIKISGEDSEVFLQSQFSNDVKQIKENEVQINAYCQHQGKIIALIWVFKKNKNYYLSFPSDLKESVLSKLNMFKLMSKVEIEDVSEKIFQYGLIKEDNNKSFKINENLSLLTTRESLIDFQDNSHWEMACINDSLPEINLNLFEKYIPQALNLDIDQMGVSFTKGCYPGQEIVARMHYLGKPKRRLFRFTSKFKVSIGDTLNVNGSKSLKASGEVIRVAYTGEEFQFLGVFEVSHISDQIFLNNDQNQLVKILE